MQSAPSKSRDEQAIRDCVELWLAASTQHDLDTVLSMMADDVVFMVPGQEPFGKEKFTANSQQMSNIKLEGKSDILELEVLGDRAWMRSHLEIRITPPDGKIIEKSGYVLTIFRKSPDGQWLIARDANLLQ